jgi:hypothetical protein
MMCQSIGLYANLDHWLWLKVCLFRKALCRIRPRELLLSYLSSYNHDFMDRLVQRRTILSTTKTEREVSNELWQHLRPNQQPTMFIAKHLLLAHRPAILLVSV